MILSPSNTGCSSIVEAAFSAPYIVCIVVLYVDQSRHPFTTAQRGVSNGNCPVVSSSFAINVVCTVFYCTVMAAFGTVDAVSFPKR
jgi:hypothetical protein